MTRMLSIYLNPCLYLALKHLHTPSESETTSAVNWKVIRYCEDKRYAGKKRCLVSERVKMSGKELGSNSERSSKDWIREVNKIHFSFHLSPMDFFLFFSCFLGHLYEMFCERKRYVSVSFCELDLSWTEKQTKWCLLYGSFYTVRTVSVGPLGP